MRHNSSISFGQRFVSRGNLSVIGRNNGKIIIGNNVFFNIGCSISCFESVKVGDNVMFGENVKIYDHNHEFRNPNELTALQGYTISPISIGKNCWIGTNVVILKGVEIGDNVVIGAGTVIYKNIAPNQVIVNKQEIINKDLKNE